MTASTGGSPSSFDAERAARFRRAAQVTAAVTDELEVVRRERQAELSGDRVSELATACDTIAPLPPRFDELADRTEAGDAPAPLASQPIDADAVRRRLRVVTDALHGSEAKRFGARIGSATPSELVVLGDLLHAGLTDDQLLHLFQGGHLLLPGHELLDRWARLEGVKPRTSSHYRAREATTQLPGPRWRHELRERVEEARKRAVFGQQYGLQGPFVHEVLFGPGPHGTTFLQLERAAPSRGRLPEHIADWVEYRATGNNEGPYGSSPYTDRHPMRIELIVIFDGISTRLVEVAFDVANQPALDVVVRHVGTEPQSDRVAAEAIDDLLRVSAILRSLT